MSSGARCDAVSTGRRPPDPATQSSSGSPAPVPHRALPLASAVRRAWQKGYTATDLRADLTAGMVVGIVALPLSMALAIAVGAPPQHGLYTAMVAGAITALCGGSKFQVTGPTAAFIVILAPLSSEHGLTGLMTAGFMAGILLVLMGVARLGRLIQFIPHPVTTGFTAGIATVIATLQLKDALGLSIDVMPEDYVGKLGALWAARGTVDVYECSIAAGTFALLVLLPRVTRRIPAPLAALAIASAAAAVAPLVIPQFAVATIGSRFQTTVGELTYAGIPPFLPALAWPWGDDLSLSLVRELIPAAFAIALLGAIESLLSAVVADGMTGTQHDPDAELVGVGLGNIGGALFGGIAATGALARTATNIRAGARSPVAAIIHAALILLSILLLAPLLGHVPMAALAALLAIVAWNMSEVHGFIGVLKVGLRGDAVVMLICYGLTVMFDMVIAVSVGIVLAALLFMRRMAELTQTHAITEDVPEAPELALPEHVRLYEIRGPLFFGAAQNAMTALHAARQDAYRVMILSLAKVPVIDSTGLVALDNTIRVLLRRGKRVILAGPLPAPSHTFDRAGLPDRHSGLLIADNLPDAIEQATRQAVASPTPRSGSLLAR